MQLLPNGTADVIKSSARMVFPPSKSRAGWLMIPSCAKKGRPDPGRPFVLISLPA